MMFTRPQNVTSNSQAFVFLQNPFLRYCPNIAQIKTDNVNSKLTVNEDGRVLLKILQNFIK